MIKKTSIISQCQTNIVCVYVCVGVGGGGEGGQYVKFFFIKFGII